MIWFQFYDLVSAFSSNSRYLDDLVNTDKNVFDSIVNQIYTSELQMNKTSFSNTDASVLDLHLSISNGIVTTKIYNKR